MLANAADVCKHTKNYNTQMNWYTQDAHEGILAVAVQIP